MIAIRLVDDAEDQRLRESARVFLTEVRGHESDDSTLLRALEDEQAELTASSIRLVVYRGGRLVGGHDLPLPQAGCVSEEHGRATYRACIESFGELRVVAGAARASRAPWQFAVGCSLATLVAAIAAAIASRRVARWAVAPLTQLASSLDRVKAEEPTAKHLPHHGGVREVAALHEALSALVSRLGDSLLRARRFSADAAHELRTPLTILSAEVDLLLEDMPPSPEAAALERIRSRVRTVSRLVERLLVLATTPAHAVLPNEPVCVEDVVREVVSALSSAESARVEVIVESEGTIHGDEGLLAILVENALDNALKFSNAEPVAIRIAANASTVLLDIDDRGPGISKSDRERVFEAFYRSPSARADGMPGQGIGLALVAEVARIHGGNAAFVDSSHGAKLRVELPAWEPLAQ